MVTNTEGMVAARAHPKVPMMMALLDVDPRLTGKELSERLGLSVSRLARVFKRETGVSIVDYRNRIRFRKFFDLIAVAGPVRPSLRHAASAAGFGSYAQFHRLFRARWHVAPRETFLQGSSLIPASSAARKAPSRGSPDRAVPIRLVT